MLAITNKYCNELTMSALYNFIESEKVAFNMALWLHTFIDGDEEEAGEAVQYAENGMTMRDYYMRGMPESCDTVACIGGSAACLMATERGDPHDASDISEKHVCEWLGIDEELGARLFYCMNDGSPVDYSRNAFTMNRLGKVTRDQALVALTNVVRDGTPHWEDICADIDAAFIAETRGVYYTNAV